MRKNWRPQDTLSSTLKGLATQLTEWNREVFGNLFGRKRRLWARLEGIQHSLVAGGPHYLRKLEMKLRAELDRTLDQIAVLWFQKSRVEQIKDGDRNTTYFHTSTVIRRRINRIESLRDPNGVWQVEPETIKKNGRSSF